jgi:hypothetical protein
MPKNKYSGKPSELNVIPLSPLALVKGYASSVAARWRDAANLAQRVASTVKSVDIVSDQMQVNFTPEKLDRPPLLRLPVGQQDLGLRGALDVEQGDREMLLTLRLDAYLLDRTLGRRLGGLASQATCRFNTKIRIELHDTIEGQSAAADRPLRPPSKARDD